VELQPQISRVRVFGIQTQQQVVACMAGSMQHWRLLASLPQLYLCFQAGRTFVVVGLDFACPPVKADG